MKVQNEQVGSIDLSGSMTKQSSTTHTLDDHTHTHMANMGKMIEDSELAIRNSIEGIYIQKTREVLSGMRNPNGTDAGRRVDLGSLKEAVVQHGNKRAVDSQ
jgi:capping protein beta